MDLKVGLNPYGLTCSIGIQGAGTLRGSPQPLGFRGFIELAENLGSRCVEFHWSHLASLSSTELQSLREKLVEADIEPVVSSEPPLAKVGEAVDIAIQLGAKTVRTGLSNTLCGDRARHTAWGSQADGIRNDLRVFGRYAADRGVWLAIENHQDFGSEELVEFCEAAPEGVGITFDTGNAFAVGEDPLRFARNVAGKVRHLHLKDYRAQFTDEGFRLVRCAIGDGAVPFRQIREVLEPTTDTLTASLEPGALDSRHVRLFTQDWWQGYPARSAQELAGCLRAARVHALAESEDSRTPWERGCSGDEICAFEMGQIHRSVENMKELGWMV